MTYIAVPIAATNIEQAKQQIESAVTAGAEMLELRTDFLEGLSVELIQQLITFAKQAGETKLPIITTCRDKNQGGAIDYPVKLRIEILQASLRAGSDFIDFEYENYRSTSNQEKLRWALSQNRKARLILSAHDFKTKPANIAKLYRTMIHTCPGTIPKIVYQANHINDCFDALDLLHTTSEERIVFCMGEAGLITRILAKKLGSFVIFASIDKQHGTAPGQITIENLKNNFRYENINAETELFGIIADPVGHSLSPAIHNACFAVKNMNKLYLPLHIHGKQEEFSYFLRHIVLRKWLHFRGFSVTIPHKQNALNFVIQNGGIVEEVSQKIGAVNTLLIRNDGKLKAYNTDFSAAIDAVIKGMKITKDRLKDMPVAIIGAGGVARAITAGLNDAGAKITIYNRTLEKAKNLAEQFNCEYAPLSDIRDMDAVLLINCTNLGMYPNTDTSPVPKDYLKSSTTVFDTIYNPAETMLLKEAKDTGAVCINGIKMFVNQAMAQFQLFTGVEGNSKLMNKIMLSYLNNNFKNQ